MFGNDAAPTRVYKYGAKRPHEGLDAYRREERAMHRLRNALVEIERERREASAEVVRAHFPEIADAEARLAEIDAEIEQERAAIRRRNAAQRARRPKDDPSTMRIAELRAERRTITGTHNADAGEGCGCFRCRRRAAYRDPAVATALAEVEAEAKARQKALYAAREISWANFNAVTQAAGSMRSGPPPRFVPWRGDRGRVVVQIQGGATWDELLAGVRQVRVERLPCDSTGRRSKRPYHHITLRIGRDAAGDPAYEWVTARFVLHRPIPADARVQQVWLVRTRHGVADEWSVQFVVARPAGWAKQDTHTASGACGVDLRWRRLGDPPEKGAPDRRPLLVAYAEGEDGCRETLEIPAERLDQLAYADRLRSIRDKEFELARAALVQWLAASDVPDWLREATSHLDQWRSPSRLAGLVLRWREERFAGDTEIFARMEAWRKQDRHLADWEAAQRRNFRQWRQDHYRRFAARLRWRYETVVVENTDWRAMLERPPAEENDEPEALNRRWFARAASPGLIRQAITQSVADTRQAPAAHTSRTCSECGAGPAHDWDAASETDFRCEAGHRLPVWRNAARNLLASASGGGVA